MTAECPTADEIQAAWSAAKHCGICTGLNQTHAAILIADWRRLRDEIAWLKSASYRQGEQIADSAMLQEAAAVEAERTACEAIARAYVGGWENDPGLNIADAIAARRKA